MLMLIFRIGPGVGSFPFALRGSLYLIYEHLQPITTQITQHVWPQIVYTHLQDGDGSVSVFLVIIQVANTLKTDNDIWKWILCDF